MTPDDEEISYHYDPAGQLQAITTNLNSLVNVSAPEYIVKNISYTDYGERASITYGNGTTNTYTYDARRRLNTLKHDFSNFRMTRHYKYDPLSNIVNISSSGATSPTSGALGGPVEHLYEYDEYNRLVLAEGHYTGPDDEVPDMLKQAYSLAMDYDLSHNILQKNQVHQFGGVSSVNEHLPPEARHAIATSYRLEYSGYGSGTFAHRQPHAPRKITEYPQEDYTGDPDDPRIKRKHIAYDANGNQLEILEEVKDPSEPQGYRLQSLRKNLWDAEDRLRAVDLNPEAEAKKPLIAVYTYDAGGERTIKYVPARTDARYSAKNAGNADRFESIIYPNALITAKALDFVEQLEYRKDPKVVNYTKHYYIGSERIASSIGTYRGTGGYKGTERDAVRVYMNNKVTEVAEVVRQDFEKLEKHVRLAEPFVYSSHFDDPWYNFHDPEYYSTYWYHPDHLGSSSYITNLDGEISQHMEYLPFGETLVEEHLNSNNSPYKFNAKEFDAETGNYYYGARYYSPKYNLMLSVDPAFEMYPGVSPFAYTLQNPVRYVDPTGMFVEDNDDIIIRGKNCNEIIIPTADDNQRYIDIPFDIQESRTLDLGLGNVNTNNIAVGYSVGVSAEASLVYGGEVSGNITVVNFPSNSDYSGYNYVYAEGEIKGSGGMQLSASGNVEANFFLAYSNYEGNRKPESFQGKTSTYGLSFDAKNAVGGGISFYGFQSEDKRWTGIGVGLSGGFGAGGKVGAWTRGETSSVMLSNQKPTAERSRMDRVINKSGFLPMVSQALLQHIKK